MRSTKGRKTDKTGNEIVAYIRFICCSLILLGGSFSHTKAQRYCGQSLLMQRLLSENPAAAQSIQEIREEAVERTLERHRRFRSLSKQTATTRAKFLVPVVFHILLDSSDLNAIGGTTGIEERIATQMQVLNADFNGQNSDRAKVPDVWQSRYADVGIFFCLAEKDLSGAAFKGYDLKIIPNGTAYSADDGGIDAKQNTSIGIAPWDNARYLNIWVCRLKSGIYTILGVTVPPGYPGYAAFERGITLNWLAFGKRTSSSQVFQQNIDRGRTLTHEAGHFFYLEHTWGDDGGLCPNNGGRDDGISDTPPEADEQYGSPKFPTFDDCSPSGNGVMFMNYMDYVNDSAMYMFTQEQAVVMQAQLITGGTSFSLTQNKVACDTQLITTQSVTIFPNPTKGTLKWFFAINDEPATRITIHNILGQRIMDFIPDNSNRIDLSYLASGMYFISFHFNSEKITHKFILNPY